MEPLAGTWQLCNWSAVWTVEFEGSSDEFLYQDPVEPLARVDDAGEVRGTTLLISPNGRFSQAGECDRPVLTYDAEGVQVSGVAEFGGVIREDGERGYLLTDAVAEASRLRYDDGDTRICDSVRVEGERLVRTICVITDECYGDRVVLVYNRS
jgi:hypothetical protein